MAGYEMEDVANDIKFNLKNQSHKLETSTLQNLYGMQRDLFQGSRLLKLISAERRKNQFVIYGVFAFIILALVLAVYFSFN